MSAGKQQQAQEHQKNLDEVDPLAVPLEHPRWEIELDRRDKVNMYYHVLGSIAPSQCIRKHLAENVSMTLPLTDERIMGRCAVLKAIDSWLECFSPYQISPVVLADSAPSFGLTSMWRSTGLNTKKFANIEPTGKVIKLMGGTQFFFDKDDNILNIHVHFDGNDLLRQLTGGR
jgi:hypothetical protein